MLYKSYTRTEQFTQVFRKLEFFETLELVPRFRHIFERKTKFFAIYIVTLVDIVTYVTYVSLIGFHLIAYLILPSTAMLVSTILWLPLTIFMVRGLVAMFITCFFYVYMITLYLSLRFRSINDNIVFFGKQSKFS